MIEAVLFDLDNTLVDRDRAFHNCVCAEFPDLVAREELYRLDQRGRGDRAILLHAWKSHGGTPLTSLELGSRIAERVETDSGLLESLSMLRAKFKAGIVTNGSSQVQREKIRASGLARVFPPDECWVSEEVGVGKPHPAIFLMAAKGLGVAPEHCLFVGDYWPHDGVGAQAAGMRGRIVDQVVNAERLAALLHEEGLR